MDKARLFRLRPYLSKKLDAVANSSAPFAFQLNLLAELSLPLH